MTAKVLTLGDTGATWYYALTANTEEGERVKREKRGNEKEKEKKYREVDIIHTFTPALVKV